MTGSREKLHVLKHVVQAMMCIAVESVHELRRRCASIPTFPRSSSGLQSKLPHRLSRRDSACRQACDLAESEGAYNLRREYLPEDTPSTGEGGRVPGMKVSAFMGVRTQGLALVPPTCTSCTES